MGWGTGTQPAAGTKAKHLFCGWGPGASLSDTAAHLSFHTPLSWGFNYILDSEPRNGDSSTPEIPRASDSLECSASPHPNNKAHLQRGGWASPGLRTGVRWAL